MENAPNTEIIKSNKYEGNNLVTEYTVGAGVYEVDLGFQSINPEEKEWFHGGNEKDVREQVSLLFDLNHPLFQSIKADLRRELLTTKSHDEFILKVMEVVDRYVASDMRDERVLKISDILANKTGACASKSILSGLLLKEIFPDMLVSKISGVVGRCREKVTYPFDHMWLRAEKDNLIFIFDPMYRRYQIFRKRGAGFESGDSNFDFSNYTIDGFPFEGLSRKLDASAIGGVMLVKNYDGTKDRMLIEPVNTLASQASGVMVGLIETRGGSFKTINHDLVYGSEEKGPKLKYPLIHFKKR